ncbi:heavy metal-responsive transcriptional regulator [Streptomyces sp. P9(2023)]|uniref:heavy metal-responsive transcriptional regulator n=1 Tax=Streptomyces sp. P9(2023) TaxID=3064394 RepID=UPI0028F42B58|nr:heavy metal-responsive transcriptional regulator [Streptomyces sp. P9(2023)]MDT9692971.1 heavy metal-responsive transcriptional regulator [Streptomyces sp. P9(2023)]
MKIGEVARLTGASTKTIRFYEDTGLVPPPTRTPGGHRDYAPETADRLRFIRRCQAAGMSLQEVRQILTVHDRGESPCGHVGRLLGERLDNVRAQIAELVTLEAHLETLLTHAEHGQPSDHDNASVCWILESEPAGTPDGRKTTAAPSPTG